MADLMTATPVNESFLFYASNLDVLEQFPKDERCKLARIIIEYGCTGKVDCSPKERIMFEDVFKSIDDQKRRYQDGELVESYIDKLERFAPIYCSKVDDKTIKEMFKALRKLREQVRKKPVDNLENVIVDIIGSEIAGILGLEIHSLGDRLELAMVSASPEQRTKLRYYRDILKEGHAYLETVEKEQRMASESKG